MDSRIVTREIRREIWPFLRQNGFDKFSGRTAWRNLPDQIHVVNFQSFNSYLAGGIGATTFSFALNLGIYFRAVPMWHPTPASQDPSVRPEEYHCHFRLKLSKEIEQPLLPRRDVWFVAPDGTNLLETLADARAVILNDGLPWFAKSLSLEEVLRSLLEDPNRSPIRKHMIGHIAKSLGLDELADPMIAEAGAELRKIVSGTKTTRGRGR
jgi:hypothetical protein